MPSHCPHELPPLSRYSSAAAICIELRREFRCLRRRNSLISAIKPGVEMADEAFERRNQTEPGGATDADPTAPAASRHRSSVEQLGTQGMDSSVAGGKPCPQGRAARDTKTQPLSTPALLQFRRCRRSENDFAAPPKRNSGPTSSLDLWRGPGRVGGFRCESSLE